MPNLTVNGITVHFQDTAESKPAVVFNHGFFMDSTMFNPQIEALKGNYRVVSIDARGHGKTSDEGQPFTYWDLARDTFAVMDHLGIDHAVLAGMSQGGFTMLRAALLAPERVVGLVLISTEAAPTPEFKKDAYYELLNVWEKYGPSEELVEGLAGQLIGDPAFSRPWKDKWLQMTHSQLKEAMLNLIERDDVTERLSELTMPALVVNGALDLGLPEGEQAEFASRLNLWRLERFADAGHAMNITRADRFNALLLDFLGTLEWPETK